MCSRPTSRCEQEHTKIFCAFSTIRGGSLAGVTPKRGHTCPQRSQRGGNVSFPVLQSGGSPGTGYEDFPALRAIIFMN